MNDESPEALLRGWARAYREGPAELRFPSDPNAEFFPNDMDRAADEIWRLRATLARIAGRTRGSEIARIAEEALGGVSVENAAEAENAK